MTWDAIVPPSPEVIGEAQRRCSCIVCRVERRLADLAAAVNSSPLSPADRVRIQIALACTVRGIGARRTP